MFITSFNTQNKSKTSIIVPVLQMSKLRHKEAVWFIQVHTAIERKAHYSQLCLLDPNACVLNHMHQCLHERNQLWWESNSHSKFERLSPPEDFRG